MSSSEDVVLSNAAEEMRAELIAVLPVQIHSRDSDTQRLAWYWRWSKGRAEPAACHSDADDPSADVPLYRD